MRRAYVSFWILIGLYIISLFANFIANDKPLIVKYEGKLFFPVLRFYSGDNFGLGATDIPNYKQLNQSPKFKEDKGNFIFFLQFRTAIMSLCWNCRDIRPTPPTGKNWLGTDDRGRDILTRLLYGYRISFSFALLITFSSISLGVLIGALQGYFSGWFDLTVQRLIEDHLGPAFSLYCDHHWKFFRNQLLGTVDHFYHVQLDRISFFIRSDT